MSNITLSTNLQTLEDEVFRNCTSLNNIELPNSLQIIGNQVFEGCSSLSTVLIPANVERIGEGVLIGCSQLNNVVVDLGNKKYDSRNQCNAIIETGSNTLIAGCKNTIIPNDVIRIGRCAFSGQSGLTSIDIPKNVESFAQLAFVQMDNPVDFYVDWTTPIEAIGCIHATEDLSNLTLHVPYGTKPLYEAAEVWKDFGAIVEKEPEFVEIADGTIYSRGEDVTTNIKYIRSFSNTNWQALYIPFSIPIETLAENGLKVAELNDTHQWDFDGDGIADSTRVEFFTLCSGSTMANHPYLIKADAAFDLTLELSDVELKPAEENSLDCSSTKQLFTFCGTYTGVSGADMYSNNYYAMAGGSLKRVSGPGVSLKPQRWYLKIENRNGTPVKYFAPTIRISIDGIDGEPDATGLSSVICREEDNVIYGLDGVRQDASRLTKGLYIQNGQKVIVR